MAEILSGKETAASIDKDTLLNAARLEEAGVTPCLAVVRVGCDPADISYERSLSAPGQ